MALPPRSFAVIGATANEKRGKERSAEISACRPGEPVKLRRAHPLQAHRGGIEVRSARDRQIGYIHAEQAASLLSRLELIKAVFQTADTFGAVVRVSFDGTPPTLPEERRARPKRTRNWPPHAPRDDFVGI